MYQSIFVPIDTSQHAQLAANIAAFLAKSFSASLASAHVLTQSWKHSRIQKLGERFSDLSLQRDTPAMPDQEPTPVSTLVGQMQQMLTAFAQPYVHETLQGQPLESLMQSTKQHAYELIVMGATGDAMRTPLGSLTHRLIRQAHVDTLVIKDDKDGAESNTIVVGVDGSKQSYAGLQTALALAKILGKQVEAIGVYDPYLHYTLFNGIVNVLSEQASQVFKFADQEKLHEEIIDTGLAKIYQAHLEVAGKVAKDEGVPLKLTLLDGKGSQKLLQHVRKSKPWLLVLGRIGVHSDDSMDIGATAEHLLRFAPCHVLIASRQFQPAIDQQAEAAIEWLPEARKKMERVPDFVRGVATTAILRWAMERGHSIITTSVINAAMGDLLPPSAAQAMGYVAEEAAIFKDKLTEGVTYICVHCGHAAKGFRPVACPVCKEDGKTFEAIDRNAIESIGKLNKGALEVEETFDGTHLQWVSAAKEVLRRVPSGYERRRSKARIEKTAKVRGLSVITEEFALDMIQQELAEGSYLSAKGERMQVAIKTTEVGEDVTATARDGSTFLWTEAAWIRMCRVPEGFMRDMTREKVESYATSVKADTINLERCEAGIAEGRRLMMDMLANYKSAKPS